MREEVTVEYSRSAFEDYLDELEDEWEGNITQRILSDEINPDMSTEDLENNIGYIFVYYIPNIGLVRGTNSHDLQFNIPLPDGWQQWATVMADLDNPILTETQFVGDLDDRDLVENMIRNELENHKAAGRITDYRMRRNYIRGYS